LTIIPLLNEVYKDFIRKEFDLSSYGIPSDIHALQWLDNQGEIEYIDKINVNTVLTELPAWASSIVADFDLVLSAEEQDTEEEMGRKVRIMRTHLLSDCDWTQLPDNQSRITEAQLQAWNTYRQELRDLPTQAGFPFNVVYPTKPD